MVLKTLIVILIFITICAGQNLTREFQEFVKKYNKIYTGPAERAKRFQIWVVNRNTIANHNKLAEKGLSTFTMEMNKFGDMTPWEVVMGKIGLKRLRTIFSSTYTLQGTNYPDCIDYRLYNWVTPPKDQGNCGSCWAFAATATLESHWAKKVYKPAVSLSAQQLVDCNYYDSGCDGGGMTDSYQYISEAGGINTWVDYPYNATEGRCKFQPNKVAAKVNGYVALTTEEHVLDAMVYEGPISISLDAVGKLSFYKEGVYQDTNCSKSYNDLNHAVSAVGYGITENGIKYWIVKNSWGTDWGMDGFFMIARGKNECGVGLDSSFPLVRGPEEISSYSESYRLV